MGPVYRERQAVLREALAARFGERCEILGGQAGLHLVLQLPAHLPDRALVSAARELGVTARPLSLYYADATGGNGLVLGYGMAESARIPELVDRLGLASESLEKTGHQPGH